MISTKWKNNDLFCVSVTGTREDLIADIGMITRSLIQEEKINEIDIIASIITSFMEENKLKEFYAIVEASKGFDENIIKEGEKNDKY